MTDFTISKPVPIYKSKKMIVSYLASCGNQTVPYCNCFKGITLQKISLKSFERCTNISNGKWEEAVECSMYLKQNHL